MIKLKKKNNAMIKHREREDRIKLLHHGHAFIQEKETRGVAANVVTIYKAKPCKKENEKEKTGKHRR
jgi:hypothetical protein